MTAAKLATAISRAILLSSMAAVIFVMADFMRFADSAVVSGPVDQAAYSDGIVVFTGRSDTRVRTGVALLEEGRGQRLLISGVNDSVRPGELRKIAGGSLRNWECCIELGRDARDTRGNARELREWIERYPAESITLVTENFHMERARLEVAALMPDLKVTPWPVAQPPFTSSAWWNNGAAIKALAQEYTALMAARLRLFLRIDLKEGV